jgi:hypothetical protein
MRPLRWRQSLAVKSFAIAFLATHVPLLALVGVVVLKPGWLSPVGVLAVALGATVLAAMLVIGGLWRLLRPLRQAADGLRDFMLHGHPLRLDDASGTEVGRLVQVLVLALAHLDRGRAPLLHAGALALERKAGPSQGDLGLQFLVLVEVDQWMALDAGAKLERMQEVQAAMNRQLGKELRHSELMLPWGRGRFLLVLQGPGADVVDRLQPLCAGFQAGAGPERFTCSAAVEVRAPHSGAWPAALQRLDHRLFAIRLEGRRAFVG